jgi:EAL domain-containing protein (putative c-di-GMP-specific phosphodiesterase class I)
LVVPLAHTLLCRAVDLLERLGRQAGGEHVRMNVNVSRRQLADPTFLPTLTSLVRSLAVPPERLSIEVTESVVTTSPDSIRASLVAIKALGVQIHIDDFGTGLSSLSLLRTLPLDGIKVDRSFIDAAQDREAIAILHAIITLGRNLRKITTAEGLETMTHMATVLALECDMAQGFLLGRPVDAARAADLLTTDFSSRVAAGRVPQDGD